MNYYKPTSAFQKAVKIAQIHWLCFFAKWKKPARAIAHRNTSVLMVVPGSERVGGYERQAAQLASSVTARGLIAGVLTERTGGRPSRELRGGLVYFRVPGRLRPVKFLLFLSSLLFLFRRRRFFQVLHAHGVTGFSLLAVRVARMLGKPAILKPATCGDVRDVVALAGFRGTVYRDWIRSAGSLVAISDEIREEMLACGIPPNQIVRIPNFVDTSLFVPPAPDRKQQLRSRLGAAENDLVFLYLGRLEERKGVEHLLRAWQRMRQGRLWLAGGGPEEEKLKSLGRDLQLSNVSFHGATTNPLDFYQSADILVFPSLREGVPNVLLEAMSCGLPCVATSIGGVTDLIRHGVDGYLAVPGDSGALADAMQHAADHPAERKLWGESAAAKARELFDISRITSRYLDLYSELLK